MYALVLIVSNLHISLLSLKDTITRLNLLTYLLFITFTAIFGELQATNFCILCILSSYTQFIFFLQIYKSISNSQISFLIWIYLHHLFCFSIIRINVQTFKRCKELNNIRVKTILEKGKRNLPSFLGGCNFIELNLKKEIGKNSHSGLCAMCYEN